jgi:pimeloyl-ACP methyl ester carboxylesterase
MPYTAGRVRLYYEVHGEGPPLVLIHANPFDHRLFTYQLASFSQLYTVIAIDIRGYGRSDKPETPFSLRDMADDILEVCAQEKISHAVFAGVSVGSGIAMLIGLDQPDMVDALILVGGGSGGGDVTRRIEGYTSPDLPAYHMAHMRELFAPGFFETRNGRWVQALFGATSNNLSGQCIAQIFRARSSCDMSGRLTEMKPGTLVINGEHDGSMQGGLATASRIPGAQHFVLPATGHACCIEDPQTFDARMLLFLRETTT